MNILPFDSKHPLYSAHEELEKRYQDIRIIEFKGKKFPRDEYHRAVADHQRAGYLCLYEHRTENLTSKFLVLTFGLPRPEYRHNRHSYPLLIHSIRAVKNLRAYEIRSFDEKKVAYYEHETADKNLKEVIRLWMETAPGVPPIAYSGVTLRSDKAGEVFAIYQVEPARKLGEVILERGENSISIFGYDAKGKRLIGLDSRAAYEWGFLLGDHAGPLNIRYDPRNLHAANEIIYRMGNPCRKSPEEEAFILMTGVWCLALLRYQVEMLDMSN